MGEDYAEKLKRQQLKDGLKAYKRDNPEAFPKLSPWRVAKPILKVLGWTIATAIVGLVILWSLSSIAEVPKGTWVIIVLLVGVLGYLHDINKKLGVLANRAAKQEYREFLKEGRQSGEEWP